MGISWRLGIVPNIVRFGDAPNAGTLHFTNHESSHDSEANEYSVQDIFTTRGILICRKRQALQGFGQGAYFDPKSTIDNPHNRSVCTWGCSRS